MISELDDLMKTAALINNSGERIAYLSERFIGTPYAGNTLVGSEAYEEVFIINLSGVDCFTFLDYIEAMRLSDTFSAFKENLKLVRYRRRIISYENRNHFFSDWREFNSKLVRDVTSDVGRSNSCKICKILNLKDDGTAFLHGIMPVDRIINYIPAAGIDERTLGRLKTGDYIGIYSDHAGLDATHVGIFVRQPGGRVLRHASSAKNVMKVVDQDFIDYTKDKPGIIVLRPKSSA
ncbi:MAG TPA: N-acetylmuramoyl-L-alanine amidase-like domain-containing protein [Dissulfurispiraceae bacterium]|nr:N-acetylmuramoyl-L-alanine amidase-like domain-containing protein [Dissulfurispiraceae bacterium]